MFLLFRLLKWWNQFWSFSTSGPRSSVFWEIEQHGLWWRRWGCFCTFDGGYWLNMDQFPIAQHIHWSQNNPDLPVVQLKWNPRAVKPYCPIWKALPGDIKSSLTSSQTTRWIQKQPPLHWMSPNPFSLGLSISSCRVPNPLPRCRYSTITYHIPPVYYRYTFVSAVIDVSTTSANESLLIDRGGEADKDHPDFTCFCRCF